MSALFADFARSHSLHDLRLVPLAVAAGEVIYTGALVCTTAAGLAVPGRDVAGLTFQGVAYRGFDNRGGPNGLVARVSRRICEVDVGGPWSFPVAAGVPLPGGSAFLVDDGTVSAAATTHNIRCGRFTKPDPVREGWWFVDVETAF